MGTEPENQQSPPIARMVLDGRHRSEDTILIQHDVLRIAGHSYNASVVRSMCELTHVLALLHPSTRRTNAVNALPP